MKILIFLFALMICGIDVAHAAIDQPLQDPSEEARALEIGSQLRCVVCQSQSINDSQADMARDLRQLVRDKVHEGMSDRQILDFARARYGDFILLKPPLQPNTWMLWLAPLLFLVVAGGGIALFINRRRKVL